MLRLLQLGLMGVTVLWSTGDSGVASIGGQCLDSSYDLGTGADYTTFSPSFPATCPYVTGVGATQINASSVTLSVIDTRASADLTHHTHLQPRMESAGYVPEKLSSGGGFSNVFALPSYQQSAVQGYLTNYPPPYSSSTYNASGNSRAYPDLSANGYVVFFLGSTEADWSVPRSVRYTVAVDGGWLPVYGTSASTPVIAAFLTSINDARIAAGKSTIGFINPTVSWFFSGVFA